MTKRSGATWAIFAGCLLLVVLALYWVTQEALDLERREAAAQDEAHRHEAMRLALWRMDSAFAPIIAQEAAKPPVTYVRPTDGPVHEFPPFRVSFSIDSGVSSCVAVDPFVPALQPPPPQARTPSAESRPESLPEQAAAARDKERELQETSFRQFASRPTFAMDVPPPPPPPAPAAAGNAGPPADSFAGKKAAPQQWASQVEQSKEEYNSRAKMAERVQNLAADNNLNNRILVPNAAESRKQGFDSGVFAAMQHLEEQKEKEKDVDRAQVAFPDLTQLGYTLVIPELEPGPLRARWLRAPGGSLELFLVRTVRDKSAQRELMNGIWCDWKKLERWLVSNAGDLFADGRLLPAPDPTAEDQAALLATIPAKFVAGDLARTWERASTPTRLILAVAWVAALGAIAAVGLVLRAAMSLGERRGRFVSAVTHELRTPLTTFRMYSQMLADGMVPQQSHPEYLATLKQESERLSRVVESVLLYSRLEEGRGGAHREVIACDALLDRTIPTLKKRASDGGMTPEITVVVPEEARVEVDVQAVEQILLNLVDNACKYAQPTDPRLEIECRAGSRCLEVRCRDFGPGVPAGERETVFLPFRRGELHAAGNTPGVGLGLSLARGLARALGGDLLLESLQEPGASFILRIPRI